MPLQGRLSIEHMCQLVLVSRRGFYRSLRQREPAEEETEVRSLIQQIALEPIRLSTDHCRATTPRRADRPQEGGADDAGRQSAGYSAETVHSHHKFETQAGGLPELSQPYEADGDQPAVGSRHHLRALEGRICLPGCNPRWVFAQGCRLGAGSHDDEQPSDRRCARACRCGTTAARGSGASLRSRASIREPGIRPSVREVRDGCQHEPPGESVRQGLRFTLHLLDTLRYNPGYRSLG
jgi:hypothetical protein